MKKILFCISIYFSINISESIGQKDSLLHRQLLGKSKLTDIMNVVKDYYKNPVNINRLGPDAVNRDLKHWRRYEWYMSSRLGNDGKFVNINEKLIEATGLQQNRKFTSNSITPNAIESSTGNWTLVGPTVADNGIGRVDRLAFHPTDANTVYAGSTSGGLWKTTNAGVSWINMTPDIPSLGISGIQIDPNNPNTIYILTGDGDSDGGGLVKGFGYMRLSIGVLKSTNGGSTWTKTSDFPGANYQTLLCFRLTMHPTNPDILFACTSEGIFRTNDRGSSWNLVETRGAFNNLKFKPGSSTICYAVSLSSDSARFFKSIDSGLTFYSDPAINSQMNSPRGRPDLAVAKSNSSKVYILAGGIPNLGGFFGGLLQSTNSGESFSMQSNSPNILGGDQAGLDSSGLPPYMLAIAVSNNSSARIAVGGIKVWSSPNSGEDWTWRGDLHGDIHDLGYHPVDNKLWVANDGGVCSSINDGLTWTSHFSTMSTTQFYRMVVNPDNYLAMLAGCQDNGMKKRVNNTSTFDIINDSDGFTPGYDAVDTTVYYGIINRGIVRYTNNGGSNTDLRPRYSKRPFAPNMAIHTSLGNALFFGEDTIWRTTNSTNIDAWIPSSEPGILAGWAMQTCPSNGNRVYAAGGEDYSFTTGKLRRSDNGGVSWPDSLILSDNPGFSTNYTKITYINVNPTNSNWVWVTLGGYTANEKVYVSFNAGATWTNRSGTLPNLPINCVVVDNNNNAYIGTDNGVYYWASGSNDWVPFYNNLPYVPVTDLVLTQASNKIRASTFGRGIWEADTYSACPANLIIEGTLEGQEFYEASNDIVSTGSLLTSEGTKVQMRGGNEIILQDGFTAKETTQFRAVIGPCGSGGVAGFSMTKNDSAVKLPPQRYLPPTGGKKSMVHIHTVINNEIQFEINQKKNGETDLLLTDEWGNIISSKKFPASSTGKWTNNISTAGRAKGIYYLQVLLDKRVEHLQEVIIN